MEFLRTERVARIATVNSEGTPHVVPICFVFNGKYIYSALGTDKKRLANMVRGSRVSILVDRYEEKPGEWTVLKGILICGDVEILDYKNRQQRFMRGWSLLIEKYSQYEYWANSDLTPKDLDRRRIMLFKPRKAVAWGFA